MRRIVLGVVIVLVLAAGFGVWWFLIRDDAPPEVALVDRDTTTTQDQTGGSDAAADPDGDWVVSQGADTFAGFRIIEHFPGSIENTAVVRSSAVQGALSVSGNTVDDVSVEVDLTALESKDSVPPGVPGIGNRVDQMRGDGLETDTFPTASFVLTEPIVLDAPPTIGELITVEAQGDLTIHGVTQPATIPIEARWSGDVIDVVGSTEVALADFGMEPPSRQFVSVDDVGTLEFQLMFKRT